MSNSICSYSLQIGFQFILLVKLNQMQKLPSKVSFKDLHFTPFKTNYYWVFHMTCYYHIWVFIAYERTYAVSYDRLTSFHYYEILKTCALNWHNQNITFFRKFQPRVLYSYSGLKIIGVLLFLIIVDIDMGNLICIFFVLDFSQS